MPVVSRSEVEAKFFDIVLGQRACRAFTAEDVDDELVVQILLAATHAPSAENSQPWVFVVVRDKTTRKQLAELTRLIWEGGARAYVEGKLDPRILADVDAAATRPEQGAPVVIVVGCDSRLVHETAMSASVLPAVQNMLLAANALGLGSALTTLAAVGGSALAEIVGFPAEVVPLAIVPIGHPARALGPPRREPISTRTHRERYGAGW